VCVCVFVCCILSLLILYFLSPFIINSTFLTPPNIASVTATPQLFVESEEAVKKQEAEKAEKAKVEVKKVKKEVVMLVSGKRAQNAGAC
jgi:hypothetical protein